MKKSSVLSILLALTALPACSPSDPADSDGDGGASGSLGATGGAGGGAGGGAAGEGAANGGGAAGEGGGPGGGAGSGASAGAGNTAGAGGTEAGAAGAAGTSAGGDAGSGGAPLAEKPWDNPWPANVTLITLDAAGKAIVPGDLGTGNILPDLSWAASSQNACFPATRFDRFDGNHVFFALKEPIPAKSILTVRAIPKTKAVDVSLYGYTLAVGEAAIPPLVYPTAVCEASYDGTPGANKGNPGVAERIEFQNPSQHQYGAFFAVAGPGGATAGAFDLEVTLVQKEQYCFETDVSGGGEATSWDSKVKVVDLVAGEPQSFTGDLADGAPVCPLDWAWDSGIACFPETRAQYFRGNHVFYGLSQAVPGRSVLDITVTPDPGVTANIYATRGGTTDFYSPPFNIASLTCEADYPTVVGYEARPGEPHAVQFTNPGKNPYNIFFAIAGDQDIGTKGKYRVDLSLQVAPAECSVPAANPSAWPGDVTQLTLANGATTLSGDLSSGKKPCTLSWASQSNVACWPGPDDSHFKGNHVFYALKEPVPPKSQVTVKVKPKAGVDVNLYGFWTGTDWFYTPPYLPSVGACEASYPASLTNEPNPGEEETVTFLNPSATNSYNYFFAVAGDETNGESGAYDIDVTVATAPPEFCSETLPGSSYSSWPSSVAQLTLDDSGQATAAGDLAAGSCTHLGFAQQSDVACFPATQVDRYQGNQQFFALAEPIPGRSKVTVTATPKPGVDVNLYGFLTGTNDFPVPPRVPGVVSCEVSDSAGAKNPGVAQSISFQNTSANPFNLFWAVAGPKGVLAGQFDVSVAVETEKPHCPESLPGATYGSWPEKVKAIDLDANGSGQIKGDLGEGACTNLGFADDSNVACFPAVRNYLYEGNHVYYSFQLKPGKRTRVIAAPAPGVDVNLYAIAMGTNEFQVPPRIESNVICEASYPIGVAPPPNPGAKEELAFDFPASASAYNVLIGVAGGAEKGTSGAYTLYVARD
jgi:hypothetical protein